MCAAMLGACASQGGSGGGGGTTVDTAAGPDIDGRVVSRFRSELDACLAIPGPASTAPAYDYPESMLDGFDVSIHPRQEAPLRSEIAHAETLLQRAGEDPNQRLSALYVLARLEHELAMRLEGEAAAAVRQSELAHYRSLETVVPESPLSAVASLRAGRVLLLQGDTASAQAAFTRAKDNRHARGSTTEAAQVNLAMLAHAAGDQETWIDALRRTTSFSASRGNPRQDYQTARLFTMLGKYHLAWAYRSAGIEDRALATFRETMQGVDNGENEPSMTAGIAAAAARDICNPWRAAGAAQPAEGGSTEAPPAPHVHMRLFNASGAAQARSIVLRADGVAQPLFDAVTPQQPVPYLRVELGAHDFVVHAAGADPASEPLARIPASTFEPFTVYTVVLYGGAGRNAFRVDVREDAVVEAGHQSSILRFFNAMDNSEAVEVCRVRSNVDEPLFSGAAQGGFGVPHLVDRVVPVDAMSNAIEFYSSVYTLELQIRAPGRTPCTGRLAGTARVRIDRQLNGTITAVGDYRSRRNRGLWMCSDAPSDTNCITVELDGR
ncbi:MAG: hypothetical protein IPH72_32500 [Sandaracinaceae bacterium]|nr:hypothetical protein [Sandaracinaceae bacterium]